MYINSLDVTSISSALYFSAHLLTTLDSMSLLFCSVLLYFFLLHILLRGLQEGLGRFKDSQDVSGILRGFQERFTDISGGLREFQCGSQDGPRSHRGVAGGLRGSQGVSDTAREFNGLSVIFQEVPDGSRGLPGIRNLQRLRRSQGRSSGVLMGFKYDPGAP